jgi:hypothetical protein
MIKIWLILQGFGDGEAISSLEDVRIVDTFTSEKEAKKHFQGLEGCFSLVPTYLDITDINIQDALKIISKKAEEPLAQDEEDFMIDDYAAGNIDDAYSLGMDAGQTLFARDILKVLGA